MEPLLSEPIVEDPAQIAFDGNGRMFVVELRGYAQTPDGIDLIPPIGRISMHEVLVRIAGVGVCHTDIVVRDQYFPTPLPAVLGHEGSGVVEAVGSRVTTVARGDHAPPGVHGRRQRLRRQACPGPYPTPA